MHLQWLHVLMVSKKATSQLRVAIQLTACRPPRVAHSTSPTHVAQQHTVRNPQHVAQLHIAQRSNTEQDRCSSTHHVFYAHDVINFQHV